MTRILILFAHPALEKSRVHRRLLRALPALAGITLHDLYEAYPAADVDVRREQALLQAHDLVVLQHPFYWYGTPPLLKQWMDLVLEHGWAYGSGGTALHGKRLLSLLTAGGGEAAYRRTGSNRFTVRELLAPVEQTAHLCGMDFLPPYVIYGTHRMDDAAIDAAAAEYRETLAWLAGGAVEWEALRPWGTLNEARAHGAAEVAR